MAVLEIPSTTTKKTRKRTTTATRRSVVSEAAAAAQDDEAGTAEGQEDREDLEAQEAQEDQEDSVHHPLHSVHLGPDTVIMAQKVSLKADHRSEVAPGVDVDGVLAVGAGLTTTLITTNTTAVAESLHHRLPVAASTWAPS